MTALRPPDPPLTDGVIALRRWRAEDAERITELCQDADIQRFARVPSPYRDVDARMFLAAQETGWLDGTEASFAATRADDDRAVLASCSLRLGDEQRGDIGYIVAAEARGRGVAGRAVGLLADWGFHALGLARITLHIHVDNAPSLVVAARAGFTREGVLRGHLQIHGERADYVLWSLLPGDRVG